MKQERYTVAGKTTSSELSSLFVNLVNIKYVGLKCLYLPRLPILKTDSRVASYRASICS